MAAGDWAWPAVAQHAPGYPIFLASLLVAGDGSLKFAIFSQALLGAATAVFVALAAQRRFGQRAGLFAGLAYALYGPLVYIDTAILSEGLLLFLLSVALWALSGAQPSLRQCVLAGAAFGGAALVRPTALIPAAACMAWMLVRLGPALAATCAAATMAVMLPAVAKSAAASGTLSLQGYGGLNVYIGNSPLHDGRATFRLGAGWDALNSEARRAGVKDPVAQDRYYLAKTWREISDRPLAFVNLLGTKLVWLLQNEESRDSHSFYFFAEQSALLRALPRWWLLFPIGVVGIVAVRGRHGVVGPYLIGAAASVVLLVVGLRYRMPFVLGLTVMAGAGVERLATLIRSGSVAERATSAGVAAAAVVLSLMLHDPRNRNTAEEWAFTGGSLITEHRLSDAENAYRQALALDPQLGLAWDGLGLALLNGGRTAEARDAFDRAVAADADSARALYHLGLVHAREGRLQQAVESYQRALALSPLDTEITLELAGVKRKQATELGMAGRTREARDVMQSVVELTPRNGDAWLDLCLLSLDLRDVGAAEAALRRAQEAGAEPQKLAFASEAIQRSRR